MARPSRTPLNATTTGWVSRFNTNAQAVIDRPIPLKQYADTSAVTSAKNVKLNDSCLTMVGGAGAARLFTSDTTNWREEGRYPLVFVANLVVGVATLADIKNAYNALLTDMKNKGYMSAT